MASAKDHYSDALIYTRRLRKELDRRDGRCPDLNGARDLGQLVGEALINVRGAMGHRIGQEDVGAQVGDAFHREAIRVGELIRNCSRG